MHHKQRELILHRAMFNGCHAETTCAQIFGVPNAERRLRLRFVMQHHLFRTPRKSVIKQQQTKTGDSEERRHAPTVHNTQKYLLRRISTRSGRCSAFRPLQHAAHRKFGRSPIQSVKLVNVVRTGRRVSATRIRWRPLATDHRVGGRRAAFALLAAAQQRGHFEFVGRCAVFDGSTNDVCLKEEAMELVAKTWLVSDGENNYGILV